MRLFAIAFCCVMATACVADPDTTAPDDPTTTTTTETTTNESRSLLIPNELRMQPPTLATTAHTNCGHMVWCNQGGRAIYCYYNQKTTGCTLQNIIDDFNSDCQYVCGHTLCLYATIESCSSI